MKGAVRGVDAKVGQHDDFQYLHPGLLARHPRRHPVRHQQGERAEDRHEDQAADEVDDEAVEGRVGQVVEKALAKNPLQPPQRKQPFQRNEDQQADRDRLQAEQVGDLLYRIHAPNPSQRTERISKAPRSPPCKAEGV